MLRPTPKRSSGWLLCGILAASLVGCDDDMFYGVDGRPMVSTLTFYNELDKPTAVFQSGEQIKWVFTVANVSAVEMTFNFTSSCQFTLETADGPDGPWRTGLATIACLTVLTSIQLDPGESHSFEGQWQAGSTGTFWFRGRLFSDMLGSTSAAVTYEVTPGP